MHAVTGALTHLVGVWQQPSPCPSTSPWPPTLASWTRILSPSMIIGWLLLQITRISKVGGLEVVQYPCGCHLALVDSSLPLPTPISQSSFLLSLSYLLMSGPELDAKAMALHKLFQQEPEFHMVKTL